MDQGVHLPPLDQPCPQCKGLGKISNPEWIEWSRKVRSSFENIKHDDAVKLMKWFNENHPKPNTSQELECPKCGGLGAVPTEAGWMVLKFVKTFVK